MITAIPADRTRLSFTAQAGLASTAWFALSRWGEPAASRQGEPEQQLVDRQAGLDITGLLDGALNYAIIFRTIVLNIIAVSITRVEQQVESIDLRGQRKIFIVTHVWPRGATTTGLASNLGTSLTKLRFTSYVL